MPGFGSKVNSREVVSFLAILMAVALAPTAALAVVHEVPSLGEWGLLLLSLILLTGGWLFIRKTSKPPPQ